MEVIVDSENTTPGLLGSHILLFEPLERLRGGVGLVIVPSLRKGSELVQIFLKPRRLFRQMDKAILDCASHGMHAHDFVHRRYVPFDRVHSLTDQFLDQLRSGSLVLDEDCLGIEGFGLFPYSSL